MSYQVIARKWRPQTFEEVTGQEHITKTLRGAIEHERLHHAYLFSGARGVGKTTTARLLAKAVNCHKSDGPTPTPCSFNDENQCPSCREIAEGRSIDVLEIDAASNTGVDNVRDAIINTVGVRPARDRYKVFIIDEVHMLSGAAFNALLKTLEEPPPRVLFIMATTESHKVPDTILSRCQQFEFRTIATTKIAERLKLIAKAEKVKISEDALREVARAGEGSMRDAQSAFDQVISFSDGKIETADVEAALGLAGSEMLSRVMRSVATENAADALAVVDSLVSRGHDLRNFCRDMLAHVRDLLVLKVAGDSSALADAGEAERRGMLDEAKEFSESDLVRFFHSLTETEKNLRESAHPRYQLEIGLVKLVEMRRLAALGQIVERLNALEEALRGGRAPAAAGGPSSTAPASGGGGTYSRRGGASSSSSGGGASSAAPVSFSAPYTDGSARASAPLDLSNTPPASQTPHAGLKLVPPPAEGQAQGKSKASANVESEPPFAADGAVRATATGATPYAPSSEQYQSPPPLFNPQGAGNGTAAKPQMSAPAPSSEAGGDSWSRAGAAEADGPVGKIKRALDARRKPFLAVAIEEAKIARMDADEFFVSFTPDKKHLRDTLAKPDNVRLLQEVCREAMGRDVGVRIVVREAGEGEEESPLSKEEEERREKQALRARAESHPDVQQYLRTFRAEIIEVRRVEGEAQPRPE